MADDGPGDGHAAASLPEDDRAWIDQQAQAMGVSREEYLRQLVAAYRSVRGDGDSVQRMATRHDLAEVAEEIEQKIADLRERIIDLKVDLDRKAPADHDHPELEGAASEATAAVPEEAVDAEELDAEIEALREYVDAGLGNYDDSLVSLDERTADLQEKLTTLAGAVVEMRDTVREAAGAHARREALESLLREANRLGVRSADCAACDNEVDLATLVDPACPHCAKPFDGVRPKQSLLGSPTLTVGDAPALEAGDPVEERDLETILEARD